MKILDICAFLLISLLLAACASTFQLSNKARILRNNMTTEKAETILADFAQPTNTQGGICLIGADNKTKLAGNELIITTGAVIYFSGTYAESTNSKKSGISTAGNNQLETDIVLKKKSSSLDTSQLTEVLIFNANKALMDRCQTIKSGYLVVMKTSASLPEKAELSINAANQDDLDAILATLSFFSPKVKLAGRLKP